MPEFATPMSKHDTQNEKHELLLLAWECALLGSAAIYLSGPITTGPRFVDWFDRVGRSLSNSKKRYNASLRDEVIEPNSREIREAAIRLRGEFHEPVLEPASLYVAEWSQEEYLKLWARVIERFAARIIMMPGWDFSSGCATELLRAFEHDLPVHNLDGSELILSQAADMVEAAVHQTELTNTPIARLKSVAEGLRRLQRREFPSVAVRQEPVRKDLALDQLAELINVAQFVSFSPWQSSLKQERCRVLGFEPGHRFGSIRHALGTLLERSSEQSINLRSYTPESPLSRELIYGIRSVEDAVVAAERLASEGLFVIANETIDIHDGGVSGVVMGDVLEFAPDDTPRCVEKPGVASLPRLWGIGMLSTVYGFTPDLAVPRNSRLEFSIHPKPQGWRHTHTLGWEYAEIEPTGLRAKLNWPNRFSRMVGDKVFGLLVAHLAGMPVPQTTVINRRLAPFTFGRPTGSSEVWLRTSPFEQVPGKFTTRKGWSDPFKLLYQEDPEGSELASVLSQAAVPSCYAGAAIMTADGEIVVEGKSGEGDTFMQGIVSPEKLPDEVRSNVLALYQRASNILGAVRFEWVFDGHTTWVVQLHRGATQSTASVLVPGNAEHWVVFEVHKGLQHLRQLIAQIEPGAGLILRGEVGLTSHIADVIRRAGIPAKIGSA